VEKVVIVDEDERERITFVGPYLEHQPLQLICRATGGKPQPQGVGIEWKRSLRYISEN